MVSSWNLCLKLPIAILPSNVNPINYLHCLILIIYVRVNYPVLHIYLLIQFQILTTAVSA